MGEKSFLENLRFQANQLLSEVAVLRDTKSFRNQLVGPFADEFENLRVARVDTQGFRSFGECHGMGRIAPEQRAVDVEYDRFYSIYHNLWLAIGMPFATEKTGKGEFVVRH